jgi:hypothetical protein
MTAFGVILHQTCQHHRFVGAIVGAPESWYPTSDGTIEEWVYGLIVWAGVDRSDARCSPILTTGLGEDTFYAEGFLGWLLIEN